jgi:hypothetical protein
MDRPCPGLGAVPRRNKKRRSDRAIIILFNLSQFPLVPFPCHSVFIYNMQYINKPHKSKLRQQLAVVQRIARSPGGGSFRSAGPKYTCISHYERQHATASWNSEEHSTGEKSGTLLATHAWQACPRLNKGGKISTKIISCV